MIVTLSIDLGPPHHLDWFVYLNEHDKHKFLHTQVWVIAQERECEREAVWDPCFAFAIASQPMVGYSILAP